MQRAKYQKGIRKAHRFLGVIFGIQFLLWTLGGLYFSWTDIDQVRGDDLRSPEPGLIAENCNFSLPAIITALKAADTVSYIKSIQLITLLQKAYVQVTYNNGIMQKTKLADAVTGVLRPSLSEQEAVDVAKSRLQKTAAVTVVKYITAVNSHHEYREKPLPAYAVTFGGDVNATVYVGAETGMVHNLRNNRWRIFDFLWMLHTMDYSGRDNMNNWLLRIFSAAGLIAIVSGLALYTVTTKRKLNKNKKLQL